MLHNLIEFTLKNRLAILLLFGLIVGAGILTLMRLPIDAFPDTTPVQVQINTVAPALNPVEIEQQVTVNIELAISGIPGLVEVRSISKFGLSQVVATFSDDASVYDSRQFIMERLAGVDLPEGIGKPELGPISTGLGEVFHYTVQSTDPGRSLDELRVIQDWIIKPELSKVPGVAEINSWGGLERQYHVIVSPESLVKYNLTFDDVFEALNQNNRNVGGGQIVSAGETQLVHGLGRVHTLHEIGDIVIKSFDGSPVKVNDIAEISIGHEIRRGGVTAQGNGQVILGLGFMLMGENSQNVAEGLREKLIATQSALPDDVKVETVYDRTNLVTEVIHTVQHNLTAGAILVIIVLFLLLGNVRAGILVAIAIPVSMIFAVLGMYQMSIAASLLSLGAIDFGILVDGSVVTTERNMRKISEKQSILGRPLTQSERIQSIVESTQEVARPILFGMSIIILVFLPILSLQGIEGKMFRPMAWTFIFALIGGLLTALFLSPILSYYLLPKRSSEKEGWFDRFLHGLYGMILKLAFQTKAVLLYAVILLLAVTAYMASTLGGEFIPKLSEGAIVINVIRLAGVDIDEAMKSNSRLEQILLDHFPDEIRYVWSRVGTAETATDPMGIELTDVYFDLHPREQWKKAETQAELVEKIQAALSGFPGINMAFTQPIELRFNELITGIRADIGIKIFGDDLDELVRLSDEVQQTLSSIEGAADVSGEQVIGQPNLKIQVNQDQIARYGIPAKNVLDVIQSVGYRHAGEIFEGQRSFPLVMRLPDKQRSDVDALANTLIPTEIGPIVPLKNVADLEEVGGPSQINREWSRRLIRVQCNVRGRDVASFVQEAQQAISSQVQLPEGYVINWGGQFENLERSKRRFMIVVPLTLLLIFILLYFSLNRLRDVLIIYTGIPFAAIGGVYALWMRDLPFSVSAAIGFIALSGIAVLNGQVLAAAIQSMLKDGRQLKDAVLQAAQQRLRPVLATAITDAAGFIPMAISTGVGAEVQRPLATVVVGGVITSTILTLVILPVLYTIFGKTVSHSDREQNPLSKEK
ncbi:MAG: efflux RND transporter permease subunit [Candidatus Omnitrophica bacterium]|nr:efflux RND transporter permease subunit [Candidatus Omnitrophota bacterium]